MDLILKLLMDGSFYLAVMTPILLAAPTAIRGGLLGVLAFWWGWLFVNWKRRNLSETVYDNFVLEARILIFTGVFEILILGPGIWKRQCGPFWAVFAVSSVLLLRSVRLSGDIRERKRFWGANGRELLGVLAVSAFLAWRPVSHGFLRLLGTLYRTCILPVLEFILERFVDLLTWLWPYLAALFPKLSFQPMAGNEVELSVESGTEWLEGTQTVRTPGWLRILGIAALLILAACIFCYLYRRLSERGWSGDGENAGTVSRSFMTVKREKKRNLRELGAERNVRYYYRQFLSLCMIWGIDVDKGGATSEGIGRQAAWYWGRAEEIEELRNLYLKARYGKKKESGNERKRAREIVKEIKKNSELSSR